MKKVLFINSAVYLPGEGGYKRSMYLLDMMIRLAIHVRCSPAISTIIRKQPEISKNSEKSFPNTTIPSSCYIKYRIRRIYHPKTLQR